ncbi:MAG: DUF4180 domain-containing protein [Prolixibacteraceae bacterium]|jgi:hypothetical protein|nr:DUF4180 domain-containing protein [Prolixibacteraceae bacterium]
MKLKILNFKGTDLAIFHSDKVLINDVQDALDIIGNAHFQGSNRIILLKENITSQFFDLKNRIAGDILQKFSNYNAKLAIVGDFTAFTSKSLKDFIYESNRIGFINFVNTLEEAKEKMGSL